ncbi:phytoene desaturase [bacterium]|nr:phytoene desaturase [bacterium]
MGPGQTSNLRRVAVVGAGLGGLSAAIHLRLRGFDITLYEAGEQVGGRANRISEGGFTFDTGPTLLNYPWVFEQLFADAGKRLEDYVELLPVEPSIRYLWPGGESLGLTSNLIGLVREFQRLEPGSGPGLFAFLDDAAEKYRFSFDKMVCCNVDNPLRWLGALTPREMLRSGIWRSLDRELARFFRSPLIREALGSYGMYLGGSPHRLPGIFSILPYGELAMGLWLPRGGIYGLVLGIEKLAREMGIRILTRQRIQRIIQRAGAIAQLEFADGRIEDWPLVIANVDVPTVQHRLLAGDGYRPPKPLKMTPAVMTFYWGVQGEIGGAGHHTVFMPQDSARAYHELIVRHRIPEVLPFYMSIASATDRALAPPGASTVMILVPLPQPAHLQGIDESRLKDDIRQRVLDRLGQHRIEIPRQAIVMERIMAPAQWGERFGLFEGSAFGAAHTLFQMGAFRYPNRERGVRGLYYTGASTTPGTGLPMVVLSGRMTAERVCSDVC